MAKYGDPLGVPPPRRKATPEEKKLRQQSANKRRYAKHADKIKAASQRRRDSKPDVARACVRASYRKNPIPAKVAAKTRKMRLKKVFVEPIDPRVVHERGGGVCWLCEKPVALSEMDIEHVMPISKGGLHCYDNVRPAHSRCNRIKGAKIWT